MSTGDAEGRDDDLAAAEYVVGVMPHHERIAFARRMSQDERLRSAVAEWEGKLSPLLDVVEPVPPPPGLLHLLEQRLFPVPTTRLASWAGLRLWQAFAVASFVAFAAISTAYFMDWRPNGIVQNVYVAELSGSAGELKLVTLYDPKSGLLRLNRIAGQPAQSRSFELWLLVGNNPPISLGLLPEQENAVVQLPLSLRKAAEDASLAISDEPFGGSPTGQPTGAVLAAAKLNAV